MANNSYLFPKREIHDEKKLNAAVIEIDLQGSNIVVWRDQMNVIQYCNASSICKVPLETSAH